MAKRGVCALNYVDLLEIKALYNWGMQVWMICAFYDVSKKTLHGYLREMEVQGMLKRRPSGQLKSFRSSRRPKHEAAALKADPFEDAYRVVREHARVLRDTHTGRRPKDASIRSYRVAASELRRASAHSGTRQQDRG